MLEGMSAFAASTNRREFQRIAWRLALAGWAVRSSNARAEPAPRWATDPFTLGVASGQPRPDGFVLWTRLAPDADAGVAAGADPAFDGNDMGIPVRWQVFEDDDALLRPVRRGETMAWRSRGYSVHVQLKGLAAARSYRYRFECGNARSIVGRT